MNDLDHVQNHILRNKTSDGRKEDPYSTEQQHLRWRDKDGMKGRRVDTVKEVSSSSYMNTNTTFEARRDKPRMKSDVVTTERRDSACDAATLMSKVMSNERLQPMNIKMKVSTQIRNF